MYAEIPLGLGILKGNFSLICTVLTVCAGRGRTDAFILLLMIKTGTVVFLKKYIPDVCLRDLSESVVLKCLRQRLNYPNTSTSPITPPYLRIHIIKFNQLGENCYIVANVYHLGRPAKVDELAQIFFSLSLSPKQYSETITWVAVTFS